MAHPRFTALTPVAGVVNMKFRQDYRGAEISTSYGNSLDTDSGEETASLLFGIGNSLTNITGLVDYYHRNGLPPRPGFPGHLRL